MSGMKALTVDAASRTAVLQPGVTTREVRDACAPHGLHFPGGHITDVGCSGFILGGGYGWGVTAFGAAADNVTAFEVVEMMTSGDDEDVRCSLRRVTAESDADLFAGLKGGGQFLAVVTEFTVALHPVPAALPCITAAYPLAAARDVAAAYQRLLLGAAPPSVEASLVWKLGRDPPHEPIALISAVGFAPAGTPDLEACYDVLRTLLPQQRLFLDDGPPLPYLEALSQLDGNWAFPGVCCYSHAMHISPKDLTSSDVIAALERHTAGMTSDRSYILCAPSAPRSTAGGASALGFRGTMILTPYALWPRTQGGPEEDRDQQHCDWVQSFRSAVAPRVLGCYLNEVMQDGRSGPSSGCFEPATFALLQRLKAQHDPLGLLKDLT